VRRVTTTAALLGAAALAGCADVDVAPDFEEVQRSIVERTGESVRWWRDAEAADAAAAEVRSTLAHDLSADDAVRIALLNDRELQAAFEELGIGKADLVAAGRPKNPSLHTEIRFPGAPRSPFEVDVTQDFLELLLLPQRSAAAKADLEATRLRVTQTVLDVAARARAAFITYQSAEQLAARQRDAARAADAAADAARRLHAAGNVTDLALATESAHDAEARVELSLAESAATDARADVDARLGLWGADTGWRAAAELPPLPETEVDPAGLESLAVERRADLAAARAELEALAQRLGMSKWAAFQPGLNVTLHSEREPDGTNTVGPGLDLPIPIFDQGQPAQARAAAQMRQGEQRYAALAIAIRTEVRRARDRMAAARARAEYVRGVLLPLRASVVEQTQLEVNGMLAGIFQLLEAKRSEFEAGRRAIEAQRDYWLARTDLERAIGGRLPGRKDDATPHEPGRDGGNS
jgi:cobalt-zinc-cadmium efflux system outer membrane protein